MFCKLYLKCPSIQASRIPERVNDDYELSVAREAALSAAQAVAASTAAVRSVNATASQTWNPGKFIFQRLIQNKGENHIITHIIFHRSREIWINLVFQFISEKLGHFDKYCAADIY
jgi:hypothetical protein